MNYTEVDLKKIAEKVVNDCLLIKPGEKFLITCSDAYYYDFAEKLAIAAIEADAYPMITMSSDEISRKRYDNSIEYLKKMPSFGPRLVEVADVQLVLAFPRDPDYLKGVSPEKMAAAASGNRHITEALLKKNKDRANLRMSSFLYPTPEAARKYKMSFEEYRELIWGAVDIDYKALSERAARIAEILDRGKQVEIIGPGGESLVFSIDGRRALIDDGVMDERDVQNNTYLQNLPAGEVYVAPVEESAEGTALFQYNIFYGEPLKNFRVRFEKGRIVEMDADTGLEHYRNIMEKQTGEKFRIAELGIGLNPRVTRVTGELALDEKIIGTVHIATGENRMFAGGVNESSIHWDMVMAVPTLKVDGIKIMDKGSYLI